MWSVAGAFLASGVKPWSKWFLYHNPQRVLLWTTTWRIEQSTSKRQIALIKCSHVVPCRRSFACCVVSQRTDLQTNIQGRSAEVTISKASPGFSSAAGSCLPSTPGSCQILDPVLARYKPATSTKEPPGFLEGGKKKWSIVWPWPYGRGGVCGCTHTRIHTHPLFIKACCGFVRDKQQLMKGNMTEWVTQSWLACFSDTWCCKDIFLLRSPLSAFF